MSFVDYFELHTYLKRKYLAKGQNYITFNEDWCVKTTELPVGFAIEDFKICLERSFGAFLGDSGEKFIDFKIEKDMGHSYKINVTSDSVTFIASDFTGIVQAIYYAEDLMKQFGDASLEIKEHSVAPCFWPRIVTSALDGGTFTQEYLNIILHYGYNGVVFYNHDNDAFELAKNMGLMVYFNGINDNSEFNYDGIIIDDIPENFQSNVIYSTVYWEKSFDEKINLIKQMPQNSTIILSIDSDQVVEKDGVNYKLNSGSLVMNQCSDSFIKCLNVAKEKGINVITSTSGCGRTNEFGTVPFIPAMMQWFMRNQALKKISIFASLESEKYGFIPNIVGEFTKSQLLSPCDEGGIAIQKIASMHYGAENTEKVMMAFKKVTDGVNWLVFNDADKNGPLQFGPAYPLINGNLYEYDFDKSDATIETDINMKACDAFNKAAMILSHIDNEQAKELSVILNFIVNTLVTCANSKRWYRRLNAINKTDIDYKKQFLYDQMIKIGEQEIKNAYETAELLIKAPYLSQNNFEPLCTAEALEAKIKLTQNAVNEIKKKLNYQ